MKEFSSLNGYGVKDVTAREQIKEQTNEIKKDIEDLSIYVTPQMYGAKGDGVSDDTEAIKQAINEADEKIVFFPVGKYLVTEELIFDSYFELIGGNRNKTKIIYQPSKDGSFITSSYNNSHDNMITIKGLSIQCKQTEFNVDGITVIPLNNNVVAHGGRCKIDSCLIYGFTGSQIKVYAPFCTVIENSYINGTGYKRNAENPNLCDGTSIGISLIGYEDGFINTFGNINAINNCNFGFNKYGLYITSVISTELNNCVFEPNFIGLYLPPLKGNSGETSHITVNNSWFEDYTYQAHPVFGAYCTAQINEETGLIDDYTKRSGLLLTNCKIHQPTSPEDANLGVMNASTTGVIAPGTYSELKDKNSTFYKVVSVDGDLFRVTANEMFSYGKIATRNGLKLYSNQGSWTTYGKTIDYSTYIVTNPNSDKSSVFTYDLPVHSGYSVPEEHVIDVIMNCGTGFKVWWRIILGGRTLIERKKMNDEVMWSKEIATDIYGVKIELDDATNTWKLSMRANECNNARIDITTTKFIS